MGQLEIGGNLGCLVVFLVVALVGGSYLLIREISQAKAYDACVRQHPPAECKDLKP